MGLLWMISHKHKCIFIHIPRCGGTSMEIFLSGGNWWGVDQGKTKHLIASTAKHIYKEYWDDYYKFSFVRNPWDRMVSMAKYSKTYGVTLGENFIDFSEYFKKYPNIEVDPVSESANGHFTAINNSVYLNILNEELDFIGRYENMRSDFNHVLSCIGLDNVELVNNKRHQSAHAHYTKYYNEETRQIIGEKYKKDIEYFGYTFGVNM